MKRNVLNIPAALAFCLALLVAGTLAPQAAYAADGDLDPTFGIEGRVSVDLTGTGDEETGHDMILQPDGKIVVVGVIHPAHLVDDFVVARYNTNGSLDTTFGGGDGSVTIDFGSNEESAWGVALQPDGRIVVVGDSTPDLGTRNYAVARLLSDGSLDATFDNDGKVTTHISGDDGAQDVAIQADSKIVVAGYSGYTDFSLARYNTNGSLDTTFDSDGRVTTDFEGGNDLGRAVRLQSDGKIVVAGQAYGPESYSFGLARYNTNGSLDTTFDGDGKVITNVGSAPYLENARGVAIQPDGRIISVGYAGDGPQTIALTRHNTNGSLDTTFDDDGKVITDLDFLGVIVETVGDVALQPDGKIIVGGGVQIVNSSCVEFGLVRYLTSGALDPSFGTGGLVRTDFTYLGTCAYSQINGIGIQSDGKIIAAGSSHLSGNVNFALARYLSDDTIPAACTLTFTDIPPDHTFYSNIRCLACRGIISGYADGTFKPNNLVTRGQLAKIVSNAAGFTESPDPQMFEDVSPSNTFYQWINRLARRGHMSGYVCGGVGEPCISGKPYFRPSANATRGQTSKIVSNAAGYSEIAIAQTFEDVPSTHTFYHDIERLASRNIMQGYPCGGAGEPCVSGKPYFRPANNVTRGQSAKIVANTFYPGCETP